MQSEFSIAGRKIGAGHPPFVIAELSGNHNGQIERAFALMEAAKKAGADAVKLQTYTADTMTIDSRSDQFRIRGGLWDGRYLYELYQEAQTPWDWHEALFAKARELNLIVFSSPFDETAVDFLASLDVPAYKIASFEAIDTPLIAYAARTGKPLIISTGMASDVEIEDAVAAARQAGCTSLALLHCVSGYPTLADEANLLRIGKLREHFGVSVGLSDHTLGNEVALASVALGASIIEKHFTIARADGGPDAAFSMEPPELAQLVAGSRTVFSALKQHAYGAATSEKQNLMFRRSLYVVTNVAAGTVLTREHVRSIRPGYGLPPKHLPEVIGRRAARNIAKGTAMTWDMLD